MKRRVLSIFLTALMLVSMLSVGVSATRSSSCDHVFYCPECNGYLCQLGKVPHEWVDGCCTICDEYCPTCHGADGYLDEHDTCPTCGFHNHNYKDGACTICGKPCWDCSGHACWIWQTNCETCGLERAEHSWKNSQCENCGFTCETCYGYSCSLGAGKTCPTCGLVGTDHQWEGGVCQICYCDCDICHGEACGIDGGHTCPNCGLVGSDHQYENGWCKFCYSEVCPTCEDDSCGLPGATCPTCGLEKTQHHYVGGECEYCGHTCDVCKAQRCQLSDPCSNCGLEPGDHSFNGGYCTYCHLVCPDCHAEISGTCETVCPTCGLVGDHHFEDGYCAICWNECPECENKACKIGEGHTCATCGKSGSNHSWDGGFCWNCGDFCWECGYGYACDIGAGNRCSVCGREGTDHDYENGFCIHCGKTCPECNNKNKCVLGAGFVCGTCGKIGTDHQWENGECQNCNMVCWKHNGACELGEGNVCDVCGMQGKNHNYENGSCTNCWHTCPECYNNACHLGEGNICGTCGNEGRDHQWDDGQCYNCNEYCPECHNNACRIGEGNTCGTCGKSGCAHSWDNGFCYNCWEYCPNCRGNGNAVAAGSSCEICGTAGTHGDTAHHFVNGICSVCGAHCEHQFKCYYCDEPYVDSHEHGQWQYSLSRSGEAIIATCGVAECPLTDGKVTLELIAPHNLSFDGQAKMFTTNDAAVNFAELTGATVGEVAYWSTGAAPRQLPGAPAAVGTYVAKVDVQAGGETYTLEKTYSITARSTGGSGGGGSTTCTVTFESNDGSEVASVTVKRNSTLTAPAAPTREGYVFDGWYTDKELTTKFDFTTKLLGPVTLYAGWKEKTVDLSKNQFILTIGKLDAMVWGVKKFNDVAPLLRNDRTMLPARFVAENLGATVGWNGDEQKVTVTKGDIEILIYVDSDKAYVNGVEQTLDSPAFVENDRTYTPLRFVAENLGAKVDWDGTTQQVIITR